MSVRDKQICRICLDITPTCECEAIDEIVKEKLEVLLINIDFDISGDVVACIRCRERLQNFFDFKSHCITTRTNLVNEKMWLESSHICRLCLLTIEVNTLNITDDVSLKDIIGNCFPEVDLDSVRDPLLCDPCESRTREYYEFMRNCERVEQRIHNFCQVGSHGTAGRIKLEVMLKFGEHEVLKVPTNIKIELPNAENINANVKNEETAIKWEEVHIKDEELDNGIELGAADKFVDDVFFEENGSSKQKLMVASSKGTMMHLCPKCPYFASRMYRVKRLGFVWDKEICKCSQCRLHTTTGSSQDGHKGLTKAYGCCECSYETDNKRTFKIHYVTHKSKLEVQLYTCEKCVFETKYKNALALHVKSHEDPEVVKKFKCEECPYRCITSASLKLHTVMHISKTLDPDVAKKFKCEECPFRCIRKSYLKRHHKSVHLNKTHKDSNEGKKFKCEKCPFQSHRRYDLKQHMITHLHHSVVELRQNGSSKQEELESSNETDHLCPRCPYFKRKYVEEDHIGFDSKETCKCSLCPLLTAAGLSQEATPSHKGPTKRYGCCECSYEVDRRSGIGRHFMTHQSKLEIQVYKCAKCNFESKYKNSLTKHMKIHGDPNVVKKFKCEICPFRSSERFSLKKHVATVHYRTTQEVLKKFKCEKCPFRSRRRYDLKQHMSRHSEDPGAAKKFKCEECPRRFTRRYGLKQHMATHLHQYRLENMESGQLENDDSAEKDVSKIKRKITNTEEGIHFCPKCSYYARGPGVEAGTSFNSDNKTCTCSLCPLLTDTELSQEDIRFHKGRAKPFGCCECSYETYRKSNIRKHFLKHRNKLEVQLYTCEKCGYETKYKDGLVSHMETHDDPDVAKKFQCKECPFRCIRRYGLKKHIARHATSRFRMEKRESRQLATDESDAASRRKIIKNISVGGIHLCPKCPYYVTRPGVETSTSFHSDNKTCTCPLCPLLTATALSQEDIPSHKGPTKLFACCECLFETDIKYNLTRHSVTHEDPNVAKKFKCEECSCLFTRKYSLKQHIVKQHLLENRTEPNVVDENDFGNNESSKQEPIFPPPCERKHLCPNCPRFVKKRYLVQGSIVFISDNETCTCSLCPLLTATALSQDGHKGLTKAFGCCECSYETDLKRSLKYHFLAHKNNYDTEMFVCATCRFETKRKSLLALHMKIHEDPNVARKFKCEECSFRCFKGVDLKRHTVKQHHMDGEQQKVAVNSGVSEQKPMVRSGNRMMHVCPKCPYFASRMYLVKGFGSDKETCRCLLCPLSTTNGLSLEDRLPSHKGSTKTFGCCECSYGTNIRHCLKVHFVKHQSKSESDTYVCAKCKYETKRRARLVIHMKTHADPNVARKFKCDECPFRCIERSNLKAHMAKHVRLQQYSCDRCCFSTHAKSSLYQHKRLHDLGRPGRVMFRCNQCDFRTKTKFSLQLHKRAHNPSKYKFKCDQCEYYTNRRLVFSKHVLTHTELGQTVMYYCSTCDFKSKYKCNLIHHTKICLRKKKEGHIVEI